MATSLFTINLTNANDSYYSTGISVDIPITINALAGNDSITVAGGWMTICNMGDGDDFVRVNAGTYAHVYGEVGNDRVDMYASSVLFDGGAGNDTVNVYGGTHLSGDGGAGIDRVNFYASMATDVSGGDGNDLFYGNGHSISGTINGGAGDDLFSGFAGAAVTLAGGIGNDTYVVDPASPPTIVEKPSEGVDTVKLLYQAAYVLPANVENLVVVGTPPPSTTITGNSFANVLTGGASADTIYGLGGNDTLNGNGGNDKLYGGSGADVLKGGDGADWLQGDRGRDQLWGGAGADSFVFDDGQFGGRTTSTCEVIHDFSKAEGDKIRIDLVDANSAIAGDQAFAFIGTAVFGHVAGQLRYEQISGSTFVQGDFNGDAVADFWIQLDGLHNLNALDFVL